MISNSESVAFLVCKNKKLSQPQASMPNKLPFDAPICYIYRVKIYNTPLVCFYLHQSHHSQRSKVEEAPIVTRTCKIKELIEKQRDNI